LLKPFLIGVGFKSNEIDTWMSGEGKVKVRQLKDRAKTQDGIDGARTSTSTGASDDPNPNPNPESATDVTFVSGLMDVAMSCLTDTFGPGMFTQTLTQTQTQKY
jgi:hypothetical protein